ARLAPVRAPQDLVAVPLVPVTLGIAAVGRLPGSRGLDPRLGHELLPVPLPLLQVELAELRNVLGADAQAVPAGRDPLRAGLPGRLLAPERVEPAGAKGVEARLCGRRLDGSRAPAWL